MAFLRKYEIMILLTEEFNESELKRWVFNFAKNLRKFSVCEISVISRGKQNLAYPIETQKQGNYIQINLSSRPKYIKNFSKILTLFEKFTDNKLINKGSNPAFDDKIQNLQNQINSLQQKIIQLENNQTLQIKNTISQLLKFSRDNKTIQQADSTFKTENRLQSPDSTPNDSEIKDSTSQGKDIESKTLSEDSRIHFKNHQTTQE